MFNLPKDVSKDGYKVVLIAGETGDLGQAVRLIK